MTPERIFDFVLRVDKPVGPTSHDIVAMARRALGTRRVGHTGTLDPFASGLLLICVNRATRLAEFLTGLSKVYRAVARLDAFTTTDDHTGSVKAEFDSWRTLTRADVENAARHLTGSVEQRPPAYSAKKVGGERMHRLARRGEAPEMPPIKVQVHRFDVLDFDPPNLEIEVECSSGTYVRALARDLGSALGTGGHLTRLRRTRIGRFDVADALSVEQLADPVLLAAHSMTPLQAVGHLPRVEVGSEETARVRLGQSIDSDTQTNDPIALAHEGELVALARAEAGRLRPFKVWTAESD